MKSDTMAKEGEMVISDTRLDKDGEWGHYLSKALRKRDIAEFFAIMYDFCALYFVRSLRKYLHVPKHVAFIMDGNRRWAKARGRATIEGHASGFDSLRRILEWTVELNVQTVTVYAFSILNFQRPKEEVDGLMRLAASKFEEFMEAKSFIMQKNVRVRVIGNLQLLSPELQEISAKLMMETKHNEACTLNICFPYTSGEEITSTTKLLVEGLRSKALKPEDVDEEFFMRCMYTREAGSPEILVRTSGEIRLSDFLVWQARFSHFYFIRTLWPQITIWHVLWCILDYQRRVANQVVLKHNTSLKPNQLNLRKSVFLENIVKEEEVEFEKMMARKGVQKRL